MQRSIGEIDDVLGALRPAPRKLSCVACGYWKDRAHDGRTRYSTRGPVEDYSVVERV